MSMWLFVLGLVGLALGAIVLLTVLALIERGQRALREIARYGDDVPAAGLGIARNLDAVDEAARTQELAAALPGALRKAIG